MVQTTIAAAAIVTMRKPNGIVARWRHWERAVPTTMYDSTRAIDSARCDRSRSANAASDVVDDSDAWKASNALSAVASALAMIVATTLMIHGTTSGVMRALPA